MPTKTGKTYSSFYKNDLAVNQSSNTGVDATTRVVHDGAGQSTSISLSDDVLSVQPVNDNGNTLLVKNQGGSNIFVVDTTNSKLLGGASQTALNTNYAYFGVTDTMALAPVAGTHYMLPFGNLIEATNLVSFGTGDNPSTSYDVSANDAGDKITPMLWYIPDNITVDQVYWMAGGSTATGDTINIHLLSFDFDAGFGAGKGDLSNGVVVAGGADIASLGYENVIYQSIAPASADVDAGKVCMVTFESNGTNSDYSINVTIKYHIR
mgnify:CR=1 FL=1